MSSVITEDINRRPAYNGTKDNGNRLSKDKYGGYLKAKKRKALSFFRRSMKSLLP